MQGWGVFFDIFSIVMTPNGDTISALVIDLILLLYIIFSERVKYTFTND